MGMPDGVVITRTNETTHGAYHAELTGTDQSAVLTWVARGPLRVANHTYVPPELRGLSISPDGKYVATTRLTQRWQLWAIDGFLSARLSAVASRD